LQPTSGEGQVGGFSLRTKPDEIRKIVGCLPEVSPLTDVLGVRDFLRFVGRLRGLSAKSLPAAIDRVVALCDLETVLERPCGVLSKGFKRRVGLAQAILHEPKVLLLDEPTDGLDPQQMIHFRQLLLGLKGSTTVLLSTHLLGEVEHLCDQIIFVSQGKISGSGSIQDFTGTRSLEACYLDLMRGNSTLLSSSANEL
jgi:ABC-2 type transport system ATP-binding protein